MTRGAVGSHASERAMDCQLLSMIRSSPRAARSESRVSLTGRIKRGLKKRLSLSLQKKLKNVLRPENGLGLFGRRAPAPSPACLAPLILLAAGDRVRVRSKTDIEATLDRWRSLKGCAFLEEMSAYCGSSQRVLKRVERFIDERDYRLKKAHGIVLLEGVMCSGTSATGRCDRSCLFFWREEWLERLEKD